MSGQAGKHWTHRWAVDAMALRLQAYGFDVADEVGIPDGRVDVAAVEKKTLRLWWLLEVKTRVPETGLPQLVRYGKAVGGSPRLTLVVRPEHFTDALIAEADSFGVDVWPLVFDHVRPEPVTPGRRIRLPFVHPASIARWQKRLADERLAEAAA